jgi:peptidoglycan/xylan/chitin deacetylase (PgdA/CDA1 family)
MSRPPRTPAVVTTSWDDGHPLDVRAAELLASYGLRGTFYVPVTYSEYPRLDNQQILALRRLGMEVGSHTMTHAELTRLDDAALRRELVDSKHYLEDLLGEPVPAFCYPRGHFNRRLCALVAEAGYQLGRTTVAFRTDYEFDPIRMPVGFQFVPHSYQIHVRHALKEGNVKGLIDWHRLWGRERDLVRLSTRMLEHVLESGGILHIWAHSWEIEEAGLWQSLEETCKFVAGCRGITPCTNSQVLASRPAVGSEPCAAANGR